MFTNGYVSGGPNALQSTSQVNVTERALVEEKHSLTALHYFISTYY